MFKSTLRRLFNFSNLKQCKPLSRSTIFNNSEQRNFSSTNLVSHQPRTTIEALNIIVEAEKNYDLGKIEFHNKNFAKALEYFKIAESLEPTNPSIMIEIAASLASLGRFQEAADLCDEIIKKYQTAGPTIILKLGKVLLERALFHSGFCYMKMENFDRAIVYFTSLKAIAPIIAHVKLGETYLILGKFKEAIENFTTIIELYNSETDRGKYAFEHFDNGEHVISMSYFYRGICYGELKEFQKSINDFTSYVNTTEAEFFLFQALGRRSLVFEMNGQLEEAYLDTRRQIILYEIREENKILLPILIRRMGHLLLGLKQYEKALTNFKKSLELNSNHGEQRETWITKELVNMELASYYLKRAIELEPDDKNVKAIVELWEQLSKDYVN